MEKLDKTKVPAKYLKAEPVVIEGQKLTPEPIEEVVYEVVFSFVVLKDRDGFELLEVRSRPETLYSGQRNEFQGIAQQQIPIGILDRVSQVELSTQVTRCVTCA